MKMIKKIAMISTFALLTTGFVFASGKKDVEKTAKESAETVKETTKEAVDNTTEAAKDAIKEGVEDTTNAVGNIIDPK